MRQYRKMKHKKRCKNCGELLDAIWFTATMTEEWVWTGDGYNECSAHHSLVNDPHMPVLCPNSEAIVGTGLELGFQRSLTSLMASRTRIK